MVRRSPSSQLSPSLSAVQPQAATSSAATSSAATSSAATSSAATSSAATSSAATSSKVKRLRSRRRSPHPASSCQDHRRPRPRLQRRHPTSRIGCSDVRRSRVDHARVDHGGVRRCRVLCHVTRLDRVHRDVGAHSRRPGSRPRSRRPSFHRASAQSRSSCHPCRRRRRRRPSM